MVKKQQLSNDFLAAALKVSAEKSRVIQWNDEELATMDSWVKAVADGTTSKTVLINMAKEYRKAGKPIAGLDDNKSAGAIKKKLDELYSPKKA